MPDTPVKQRRDARARDAVTRHVPVISYKVACEATGKELLRIF
jgi:hypothetical protein